MAKSRHFLPLVLLALLMVYLFGNPPIHAASCTFVLGFQTIHDQIPDIVGDCLVDQRYNPSNGDALQETTGGLLVWRKADNFTAFTDGYRSWVNGPFGLQQRLSTERFDWEASSPPEQTPTPAPTATTAPTPTPVPQVQEPTQQPPPPYTAPRPTATPTPAPTSVSRGTCNPRYSKYCTFLQCMSEHSYIWCETYYGNLPLR